MHQVNSLPRPRGSSCSAMVRRDKITLRWHSIKIGRPRRTALNPPASAILADGANFKLKCPRAYSYDRPPFAASLGEANFGVGADGGWKW